MNAQETQNYGAALSPTYFSTEKLPITARNKIEQDARFYFVHSYYVEPQQSELIAATCDYGLPFCTAIHQDNLFATQFHPEKSHTAGLQLLKNFVEWKI